MTTHLKHTQEAVRLLRHKRSNAYFTGTGWTRDPSQAKCFGDVLHAARECAQNRLKDVEFIVRAGHSGPELFQLQLR